MSEISCLAVLCVHNEEAHLRRAIGDLVAQGIDVALIDHGSTDDTAAICAGFLGRGLLRVEPLAWNGEYDQTGQLEAKNALIGQFHHDWVIHADADEWMHTRNQDETLLAGIQRLATQGYNAINFDEFVFLPDREAPPPADCKRELQHYYFFEPHPRRLMRAWRRRDGFSNIGSGGHVLAGDDLRLAPENFVLRHYIVLSQEQAIRKYAGRVFSRRDLERGWHGNRLNLAGRLRLPDRDELHKLQHWNQAALDRSQPRRQHYWDWPTVAEAEQA